MVKSEPKPEKAYCLNKIGEYAFHFQERFRYAKSEKGRIERFIFKLAEWEQVASRM